MLKGGKARIPPKISEVLGSVLSERTLAASERRPYLSWKFKKIRSLALLALKG